MGDHITVCVCTFQRPVLLRALLDDLVAQSTFAAFSFDVVVVDNDAAGSAAPVVAAVRGNDRAWPFYVVEPRRNISLARNAAVAAATGNLVAFIDDDERPGSDWLWRLHQTLRTSGADGVLGPVVPAFPADAPSWLLKAGVFERRRFSTGTVIPATDGRTGNALLDRARFPHGAAWFDPAYGRTGGEDSDFFSRHADRQLVWCDEAVARETVPPDRCTPQFHVRRLWRSGLISGGRVRQGRLSWRVAARNALGLLAWGCALGPALLFPMHIRMRVAQKFAYCAGLVAGVSGAWQASARD
jgi:glycosyltransferase involved in cell wall biosynthesis